MTSSLIFEQAVDSAKQLTDPAPSKTAPEAPRVALHATNPTIEALPAIPSQLAPGTPLDDILEWPKTGTWLDIGRVFDPESGKHLEYRQLMNNPRTKDQWQRSAANEFGRLTQGVGGRIEGTNMIQFIRHNEKQTNRKATYAQNDRKRQKRREQE